jgi:hypothetical protein
MLSGLGKALILLGGILLILGAIFLVMGKWANSGEGWGWLGRLPGDFMIKRDHLTFYFPLATSLILSIVLSIIGSVIFYLFFRR